MTLRVHPDDIVAQSGSGLLAVHRSWARVRLGEIADVVNGFAFKSSYFSKSDGVPLLRIRDVGRSATDAFYRGPYDHAYLVRRGELVVGMDGDFRAARWSGEDAVLNQRVCKITARDETLYSTEFLFYVLQGYLDAIHAHTSSVTVKHLSSKTIQEIPLPLPPLNEQRRIVAAIEEHFSRLDAADAYLNAATRRTIAVVAAVSSQALKGYPSAELGAITTDLRYGTSVKCSTEQGEVPVLRIPNVRRGRIDMSDLKYANSRDVGDCFVEQDDLLVIRTNGSRDLIGRVARVEVPGAAFASYLIRLRPTTTLDPRWAVLALSSPQLRAEIEARAASTAGQYNLNLVSLRSLPIPLPPLDEQRRIVARVEEQLSAIEALHAALERAHRRSASLRRAVLERAFRGELVPQDPSDEPASVLLERIRAARQAAPLPSRRRRVSA